MNQSWSNFIAKRVWWKNQNKSAGHSHSKGGESSTGGVSAHEALRRSREIRDSKLQREEQKHLKEMQEYREDLNKDVRAGKLSEEQAQKHFYEHFYGPSRETLAQLHGKLNPDDYGYSNVSAPEDQLLEPKVGPKVGDVTLTTEHLRDIIERVTGEESTDPMHHSLTPEQAERVNQLMHQEGHVVTAEDQATETEADLSSDDCVGELDDDDADSDSWDDSDDSEER